MSERPLAVPGVAGGSGFLHDRRSRKEQGHAGIPGVFTASLENRSGDVLLWVREEGGGGGREGGRERPLLILCVILIVFY